jgi:maleate isomerase
LVEYARKGLIGVLTPQANTTVEPEFSILLPPGYSFLAARLVSGKPTLDARLRDYFARIGDTIRQFADAPIGAFAFACTGASYLAGVERERAAVEAVADSNGVPLLTAGRAIAEALRRLDARRLALVSPYATDLTESSIHYWQEHGFEVATVAKARPAEGAFHPIYDLSSTQAGEALATLDLSQVDAVVMLGTGMPTLGSILAGAATSGVPILSSMSALAWRSLMVFDQSLGESAAMRRYFAGEGWGDRYSRALASH